jgi:hypothetical protein
LKLPRNFDGTFHSDQENPFKSSKRQRLDSGEDSNGDKEDNCFETENLFQLDDDSVNDEKYQEIQASDNEDQFDDAVVSNEKDEEIQAADNEDGNQGVDNESFSDSDDDADVPPLSSSKTRNESDDESDDDVDDDSWECRSECSQSSYDTDDRHCYIDQSLLQEREIAAKAEMDQNDKGVDVDNDFLLECACRLEESLLSDELDEMPGPSESPDPLVYVSFDSSPEKSSEADEVDMDELSPLLNSEIVDELTPASKPVIPLDMFSKIYDYHKNPKRVDQCSLYFYQQSLVMSLTNNTATTHLTCIGGFQGLVGRANAQRKDDTDVLAKADEAKVVLRYIRLINKLPMPAQKNFMSYEEGKRDLLGLGVNSRNVETIFPSCLNELNNFAGTSKYMGENSIMRNFPTPKVFMINNHACVDLEEAIQHIAGHRGGFGFALNATETDADKKYNRDGLNGSKATSDLVQRVKERLAEKYKDCTSIGWMYFWSDSFLNCFIKQKDNSVWLFTVTLSPPYGDRNSGDYTIVLAMGRSTEDHTKVIEYYYKRASELMEGFECYLGDQNEIVRVAFGLLFHSADRPERHSVGNTRTEGDWGRMTGMSGMDDKSMWPACRKCYEGHAKEIANGNLTNIVQSPCSNCFNWDVNPIGKAKDELRKLRTIPTSKDYPATRRKKEWKEWKNKYPDQKMDLPRERKPGMKHLGPMKLKAGELVAACVYAYWAFREGIWTAPQMREYLRTCNIRDSRIASIEYLAMRDRDDSRNDDAEEVDKRTATLEELVPKLWLEEVDCFADFRLPDMPMHAIAHGMVPDVMDFVHRILSQWKKFTDFTNFANPIISDIAKFGLDWLKLKSLPKSAWIGENSMAYMRLLSYLYGRYFLNARLNTEYETNIDDIKRFISAFQTVVSLLMNLETPPKNTIMNLMKLLMSTAHYAHVNYGAVYGKSVATTRKRKREESLPFKMEATDVLTLLDRLDIPKNSGMQTNRIKLEKLKKADLISILPATLQKDHKKAKKPVLQQEVFKYVLKRPPRLTIVLNLAQPNEPTVNGNNDADAREPTVNEIDRDADNEINLDADANATEDGRWTNTSTKGADTADRAANGEKSSTGRFLWQKGAWLSFLLNMEAQCQYLGMPRLIW